MTPNEMFWLASPQFPGRRMLSRYPHRFRLEKLSEHPWMITSLLLFLSLNRSVVVSTRSVEQNYLRVGSVYPSLLALAPSQLTLEIPTTCTLLSSIWCFLNSIASTNYFDHCTLLCPTQVPVPFLSYLSYWNSFLDWVVESALERGRSFPLSSRFITLLLNQWDLSYRSLALSFSHALSLL